LQAAGSLYGLAQLASRGVMSRHTRSANAPWRWPSVSTSAGWFPAVSRVWDELRCPGRVKRGVQLLSAAERPQRDTGMQWTPFVRGDSEQAVESARAALGEDELTGAWASGQLLTPDQAAVADAARPASTAHNELTARELEVLDLVAEGLSMPRSQSGLWSVGAHCTRICVLFTASSG
jgi:hypothetical protein